MNKRIESLFPGERFLLLGHTQGVYLDGFGCVFAVRVNLAEGPGPNPFRQELPEPARAALHKTKLERLPVLRTAMRSMLVNAAAMMDPVPANEKLVLSISLFAMPHEDTRGLPSQIVMQATRSALLPFAARGAATAGLESAVQVQEY